MPCGPSPVCGPPLQVKKLEQTLPKRLAVRAGYRPPTAADRSLASQAPQEWTTETRSLHHKGATSMAAGDQYVGMTVLVENGLGKAAAKHAKGLWVVSQALYAPGASKPAFRNVSSKTYPLNSGGGGGSGTQRGAAAGELAHFFNGFNVHDAGLHKLVLRVLRDPADADSAAVLTWEHTFEVTPSARVGSRLMPPPPPPPPPYRFLEIICILF